MKSERGSTRGTKQGEKRVREKMGEWEKKTNKGQRVREKECQSE